MTRNGHICIAGHHRLIDVGSSCSRVWALRNTRVLQQQQGGVESNVLHSSAIVSWYYTPERQQREFSDSGEKDGPVSDQVMRLLDRDWSTDHQE